MKTKKRYSDVGSMKQRVEFQYYSTATDALGGTAQTWNSLATVWANVSAISGTESIEADALRGNVKYKIRTRYRDDFVANGYSRATYDYDLRAVYNGDVYNIEYAVDDGEEKTYTNLVAFREVGDGS